jgi:hypothetical protein
MGPSVDIDGFCARAPILEFLRQDEREVISSEMPRTGCIVINFVIIYISFSWMRGVPPQVVKIWSLMELNVNGYVFNFIWFGVCAHYHTMNFAYITALHR